MSEAPAYDIAFLICSERSGSNLIRAMMDAHSEVAAPPPFHIGRELGANFHATLGEGAASPAWTKLRAQMLQRIKRLDSAELAEDVAARFDGLPALDMGGVLRAFYDAVMSRTNARLLFIKENNVHRIQFMLLHCFPDAKFVFQVRDPRDFLLSGKERRAGRFGNKFGSTRHALEVWREDQQGGLATLAYLGPERVHLQRYEDLIADPERVLSALCHRLGLAFEPAMLDFHKERRNQRFAKMGEQWGNLKNPVIAGNSKRYRSGLSPSTIRTVEAHLGDLMRRFGYALDYADPPPGYFRHIFLPHVMEAIEKRANGERTGFYSNGSGKIETEIEAMAGPLELPYGRIAEGDEAGP